MTKKDLLLLILEIGGFPFSYSYLQLIVFSVQSSFPEIACFEFKPSMFGPICEDIDKEFGEYLDSTCMRDMVKMCEIKSVIDSGRSLYYITGSGKLNVISKKYTTEIRREIQKIIIQSLLLGYEKFRDAISCIHPEYWTK